MVSNQGRRLLGAGALAACTLLSAPAAHAGTDAAVVRRVNAVRVQHHLPPLHSSSALGRAAAAHSRAMLAGQSFAHTAPLGGRLERYVAAHTFGETIAWMPSASAGSVVRAWLRSPPHRAVLLSRRFRTIGVGLARGSMGGRSGATFTADLAG